MPIGHIKRKGLSKVWKSHCALYGLSDSSFHWYHCLVTFLKSIGLKSCISEDCLFYLRDKIDSLQLMILIYVDDMLITGSEKFTIYY